MYGEERGI